MAEAETPKVVNTHHFGGVDKLPPNTKYIGRPGPYGNKFSSKSGKYIREECVGLHRADLYRTLVNDPTTFALLKKELGGCDLACWCKQPKKLMACHGDNYLHIFSPRLAERTYDKSARYYLMDDLRFIIKTWNEYIRNDCAPDHYLPLYIHFNDVYVFIQHVLLQIKTHEVHPVDVDNFIAIILIDLELAFEEKELDMMEYRFNHAIWQIQRFIANRHDRGNEPTAPYVKLQYPPVQHSSDPMPD